MYKSKDFEFPKDLEPVYKKAQRIEWLSIGFLISVIIMTYLVMGNIQTMKTIWLEDMLSLTGPASFLMTSKIFFRKPSVYFPYGFHSIVKIAFLISSVALAGIGLFLLFDGLHVLLKLEKPVIPTIMLFGHAIWLGYFIILIMLYKVIAPYILGTIKIRLAKQLHDKILYVDGRTNRADWVAASGGILGVIGIGLGWWWCDALIAILISLDIIKDGFTNTKHAVFGLLDETPTNVERDSIDPLIRKIKKYLQREAWVREVEIRVREDGHVYYGEAFIVPRSSAHLLENIEQARENIYKLSWRIHDFSICPVKKLP